jgi:O-antigen biosynthesis protein
VDLDLDIEIHSNIVESSPPLVSIVVIAYNHLDYTRQCIESIYRYTSHLNFELITINNGSSDGTQEYFEELPNLKKINFEHNVGVCVAINCGFRIAEGKYTMNVSNDIIVTWHWLDNLLTCMESSEKIGMAVPVCNASCNYQQINPPCKTIDEIQEFARIYNVSDPNKWEEKIKLSTYAGIYRTDLLMSLGGYDEDFNPGCYDDDAICFSIRRMGYKVIFAKDAFVHHFGAKSFNEEYVKDSTLQYRNKLKFIAKFGVDPYTAGLIDYSVLDVLTYGGSGEKNILGIGNSYGTTVLQLKNTCKLYGSRNINLFYLSEWGGNMAELKTICDNCTQGSIQSVQNLFGDRQYDYIIVESDSKTIRDKEAVLPALYQLLKSGGQLVCTAANQHVLYETIGILYHLGAEFSKQINYYYLCFAKPQ